ncbi:hypothetical protein OAI87_02005 [Paracoccaceae bacterium]|nr:hypothetical protein [Paracoccaceae bacterium]
MKVKKSSIAFFILLSITFFSDLLYYLGLSDLTAFLSIILICILLLHLKINEFLVFMTIFLFLFVSLYVGILNSTQNLSYMILPLLILIGVITNKLDIDLKKFRLFVLIFLISNLFALGYEKISFRYLLDFGHPFALFQGQGLFGWSKIQGEFLISLSLLYRRDKLIILILLFSSLLAGVRAATLLCIIIFILQNKNISFIEIFQSLKKWYILLGLTIALYFIIPLIIKTFDTYNIERFTSLLDLNSSTYSVRSMVHGWHLSCISDFNLIHLLAGRGDFCTKLLAWGAESTIIHIIEYYGLLVSALFGFLLFYNLYNNSSLLTWDRIILLCVLAIYMWYWRFGFTFQGIFVWYFIFMDRKTNHFTKH